MNKIKLSIVMPSYNEEKSIKQMIESIKKNTQDFDTDIVIVDGGTDNTAKIAKSMGVNVIKQKPQGHGIALIEAILNGAGDFIITADCDNTYPMEYVSLLIEKMKKEKLDLISCNRLNKKLKGEMPWANKMANKFFAFLVRNLYGIKVHDVTTGMYCMTRKLAHSIAWEANYAFCSELIIRSNLSKCKYSEVDIPYKHRIGETTLHKWRSGKAFIKCIFNYKFNLKIDPKNL